MKIVLATDSRYLVSFTSNELVALANCANEMIGNSSIDEHDCFARLGIDLEKMRDLHQSLITAIDSEKAKETEVFEAWNDQSSIQIRAISVFGDPADLGLDEVRDKILPLLEEEEDAPS